MKKYIILLIILLIASLNLNLFLKPHNLVTGGTQGISIIISKLTTLKLSTIVLIINITALILSYLFLRKETTASTIISTFIYPLFIRLTSTFSIISLNNHILISSIIAGIICGITIGLTYKLNFSSGGLSIINSLLKTYLNIKESYSNFIINSSIILASCLLFGRQSLSYSLIIVTISSILIDLINKKKHLN